MLAIMDSHEQDIAALIELLKMGRAIAFRNRPSLPARAIWRRSFSA
jgi:hypothetical protein